MGSFNEIINSNTPTLVDFYATWCGPCKMMSPILEDLSKDLDGKARILKIDVDKNQVISSKYKVRGVPNLIIFKEGKIVWRQAGVVQKSELMNILKQYF